MTCHFLLTDSADLFQPESFYQIGLGIKGYKLEEGKDEAKSSESPGSLLVAIVHLGGDSLFELGELVLRECAGQYLRTPFDEVVHHVPNRVKHLALVPLCQQDRMNKCLWLRHGRNITASSCL